jgi:hypothetical protein
LVSNCTVSLCSDLGFGIESDGPANGDLTLDNCRAVGNLGGLSAANSRTGNATMRITNCVVTGNTVGIETFQFGTGTTSVVGTSPGTNLITGNGSGNVTIGGGLTLQ